MKICKLLVYCVKIHLTKYILNIFPKVSTGFQFKAFDFTVVCSEPEAVRKVLSTFFPWNSLFLNALLGKNLMWHQYG